MRISRSFIAVIGLLGLSNIVPNAVGDELDALKLKRDVLLREAEAPQRSLNKKYEGSLNRLKSDAAQSGNLDLALAVAEELKNYSALDRQPNEQFPELAKLRNIFLGESRKLITERQRIQIETFQKYDEALLALEASLTKDENLSGAVAVREEREAAAKFLEELINEKAMLAGVIIVEEFDGPLNPEVWKASSNIQVSGGSAIAGSSSSMETLQLLREIEGDFKIEIDFVRDGEHVWQSYDISVKLTSAPIVAAFRLATDNVNLVYIDSTPDQLGKPGDPDDVDIVRAEERGRKTREAKLEISFTDGKLMAAITGAKGKRAETEAVAVPDFGKTGLLIRIGSFVGTPRKIERISITRR